MIIQIGILFAFLALGELVVWATGVPVPSSVLGMILLASALKAGVVKLRHVERVAGFLTHNLAFFFVPAGVGLMNCLGLLREQWLPIAGASVASTVVIIAVTGHVHQRVRIMMSRRSRRQIIEAGDMAETE